MIKEIFSDLRCQNFHVIFGAVMPIKKNILSEPGSYARLRNERDVMYIQIDLALGCTVGLEPD